MVSQGLSLVKTPVGKRMNKAGFFFFLVRILE